MSPFVLRLRGIGLSLISLAIALIPFWIFLALRAFADPEGFWQELALGALGLVALGSIQFVFGLLWLWVLWTIWSLTHDDVNAARTRMRRAQEEARETS